MSASLIIVLIWFAVSFFLAWVITGAFWFLDEVTYRSVSFKKFLAAGPGIWILFIAVVPFVLVTAALEKLE